MDDGVFKIECPCCGATLEVDAETEAILSHQAPKPKEAPLDLQKAVRQLKSEESSRDQRFRDQVQAERQHGKVLDKRFEANGDASPSIKNPNSPNISVQG